MIVNYRLLSPDTQKTVGQASLDIVVKGEKTFIREKLVLWTTAYHFLYELKQEELLQIHIQVKYKKASPSFEIQWLKKNNHWLFYKKKLKTTWLEDGGKVFPFSFFSITSLWLLNQNSAQKKIQPCDALKNTDYSVDTQGSKLRLTHAKQPAVTLDVLKSKTQAQWPMRLQVDPFYRAEKIEPKLIKISKTKFAPLPKLTKKIPSLTTQPIRVKTRDGIYLSGQLDHGKKKRNKVLIILLHGSGPEDRDAGSGYEGRDYKKNKIDLFKQLSVQLTEQGFDVFRFDKRACGQSQGAWSQTSLRQLVLDVKDVVGHMRQKFSHEKRILMGFSEGANLALSVGKDLKHELDGLILAGSPAESIDKVMLEKLKFKSVHADREDKKVFLWRVKSWQETFKKLKSIKDTPENSGTMFQSYPLNWWLEHLEHQPLREAKAVESPVLLIHGDMDSEVRPSQAKKLYAVLRRKHAKNRLIILPGLNHFFAKAYKPLGVEYDVPTGVTPQFVKKVINWINTTFML